MHAMSSSAWSILTGSHSDALAWPPLGLLPLGRNDDGLIDFTLEAVLDPSAQVTSERLRELGSDGLARRYELLEEKGIAL